MKTFTYWTVIVPCDEVWVPGVVHPHCASGKAPPIETLSRIDLALSTPAVQAAGEDA